MGCIWLFSIQIDQRFKGKPHKNLTKIRHFSTPISGYPLTFFILTFSDNSRLLFCFLLLGKIPNNSTTDNSTTENGGLASVVLGRCGDLVNDPITVWDYKSAFVSRLDTRSFDYIDDRERDSVFHGHNFEERLTMEGSWLRRWKYSRRRGILTLRTVGDEIDMPFVCCSE